MAKVKKKYYKVVGMNMKSIMYSYNALPKEYAVTYKENKWVSPRVKGTKLMVFSDDKQAFAFAAVGIKPFHIYEVEIKNPVRITPFIDNVGGYRDNGYNFLIRISQLLNLQKRKKKYTTSRMFQGIPQDTIFCSEVKLIMKIH